MSAACMFFVPAAALGACSGGQESASNPTPSTQSLSGSTESGPAASSSGTADPGLATSAPVEPQAIVDGPDATLSDIVVSAEDPGMRVAVWRSCSTCETTPSRYALAITSNGFDTRVIPNVVWRSSIIPHLAPDGSVLIVSYGARTRLEIVSPDGELRDVDRTGGIRAVQPGEIVAGVDYNRSPTFYATDVISAVAHPVQVPTGTQQLSQLDSGQLRALGRDGPYHWSDDGGASWQRADIPDQGFAGSLVSTAASGADTHAVVLGGDGATLFPFGFAARLDDDSAWTVFKGPSDPTAYLGGQVALPDGRLLVATIAWSDQGTFKKPLTGTRSGLYISDGADWSSLSRIEVGAPFDRIEQWQPEFLDVSVVGEAVTIIVHGPGFTSAFMTQSLGATWTEIPAR